MPRVVSRFAAVLELPTLIAGAVTVATSCVYCDGVLKPLGVAIDTVDIPAATGWKLVELELLPELKTTGLVVIVPTAGVEFATGTLIVASPD